VVMHHHVRTHSSSPSGGSVARLRVVPVDTVDSWQLYLVQVAHHLRHTVGNDPDALLTLTQPPHIANWVHPPIGNTFLAEAFLASMVEYGFSDEDATAIYLTFFTRILGVLCAQTATSAPSAANPTLIDGTAYPTLARLSPLLNLGWDSSDFDAALDDIITSLERDLH